MRGWSIPFNPGSGKEPPYLAGRGAEKKLISEVLQQLLGPRCSNGKLVYGTHSPITISGPSGVGKTALLTWAARQARQQGSVVIQPSTPQCPVSRKDTIASLTKELGQPLDSFFARVSDGRNPLQERLKRHSMLLLLDDVQDYDAELQLMIWTCIESMVYQRLPVAALLVGKLNMESELMSVSNDFCLVKTVRINALQASETIEALHKPFRDHGIAVEAKAIRCLAEQADNHPYLVQLIGKQVWDAFMSCGYESVTLEFVQKLQRDIDRSKEEFYASICAGMSRDVLFPFAHQVMEIMAELKHECYCEMIVAGLQRRNPRLLQQQAVGIVHALMDWGLLWKDVDRIKSGASSLASYLLNKGTEEILSH